MLSAQRPRHCIWVDIDFASIGQFAPSCTEMIVELLGDSCSKVFSAFRSVDVFLTTDLSEAEQKDEEQEHTHALVGADGAHTDWLGIATFSPGRLTRAAIIRIDQIWRSSNNAGLALHQVSNLLANTISHEIGHTLGLDHSTYQNDVMHDGLVHGIHSFCPPAFHPYQIYAMNRAIYLHKKEQAHR